MQEQCIGHEGSIKRSLKKNDYKKKRREMGRPDAGNSRYKKIRNLTFTVELRIGISNDEAGKYKEERNPMVQSVIRPRYLQRARVMGHDHAGRDNTQAG